MAVTPSPFGPKPQFVDASGSPDLSYKLFFYVAGSNTKQNTYTDSTGVSANANPLILNSLGQPTSELWWTVGQFYKVVLAPSTDTDPPTSPIWSIDNLQGMGSLTTSTVLDEWVLYAGTPTFVNATTFTVPGNQIATFQVNRRVKTHNSGGVEVFSTISNSVFGAVTTVTVVNDSGSLDAGLSDVSYGLLSATNPSIPETTVGKALRVATAATGRTALGFEDGGWILYVGAPTYISATSFSLTGDQTAVFQVKRRVKTVNTGGTVYSTISTSSFGAGITTIVVKNDSGTLDSGISAVSYGTLGATNPSIPAQVTADLTASRTKGVTYTNSTGRTMYVVISGSSTANGAPTYTVNGIAVPGPQAYAINAVMNVAFAVGTGETYVFADGSGTFTISKWLETR